MKRKDSILVVILAAALCILNGFFCVECADAESLEQMPSLASAPTATPLIFDPLGEETEDMNHYHLDVWYAGGQLPIISSYRIPLETIAENNYIPTVIIEDTNEKPYFVHYEAYYFNLVSERTFFYEPGEDGFQRYKDEIGHYVEKLEALKPGDYLMNINIWAMVYDVVYSYDCYLHIVIPGAENALPWPVTSPTPPPGSGVVTGGFLTSGGEAYPELRTDYGLFWTPVPTATPLP